MMAKQLTLHLLSEHFTINKMPQFAEIPHIFTKGDNCFIVRTEKELSIICPEFMAPNNVQQEAGWRCLRVESEGGLLEVGLLAAVINPLTDAGIPLLAVSSFDTDYIFVLEENLVNAVQVLQRAGHSFSHKES
jgi:hypothetical protein